MQQCSKKGTGSHVKKSRDFERGFVREIGQQRCFGMAYNDTQTKEGGSAEPSFVYALVFCRCCLIMPYSIFK